MISILKDTYRHQGLRRKLIDQIGKKGGVDEDVLEAMLQVPRHVFFDGAFLEKAYIDNAFPIAAGQTISQPSTVAIQSTLLDIRKKDRVLEIGTGSGYQAAVLCKMGAKVYSIERQRELYLKSKQLLNQMGCKSEVFFGDGFKGLEKFAPFQKIIITCGAPMIPEKLVDQLANGGRMVIPLGKGAIQEMILLKKDEAGAMTQTKHGTFSFVPMLDNKVK